MNTYDYINEIMTLCIIIGASFFIVLLAYACVMRVLHTVRVHDRAVCVRTHGATRDAALDAQYTMLATMLRDEHMA